MNPMLQQQVIDAATDELRAMLRENMDGISRSMATAMEEHQDPVKPFKYPVSLGLVLKPVGNSCRVTAKISYSVKHSDESVGTVVDPNQMKMDLSKTE